MSTAQLDFDEDETFGLSEDISLVTDQTVKPKQAVAAQASAELSQPKRGQPAALGNRQEHTKSGNLVFDDDDNAATQAQAAEGTTPPADSSAQLASEEPEEEDYDGPEGLIYVGDLHWWTTDANLEQECSQHGRVREVTFFEDGVNGKSKGAAKVVFARQDAAATCQAAMNGHIFHGKRCVVTLPADNSSQPQAEERPISPIPRPQSHQPQSHHHHHRNQQQSRPHGRPPSGQGWNQSQNQNVSMMLPMPSAMPLGMPMMQGSMPPMPGGLGMASGPAMPFMPPGFMPPVMPFPPQQQWPRAPSMFQDGGSYKRQRY